MDFVFARIEFIKVVGAPNESLRFVIVNYMFKYTFGIKTTYLDSLRNEKSPSKAQFL